MLVVIHIIDVSVRFIGWFMINKRIGQLCSLPVVFLWFLCFILLNDLLTCLEQVIVVLLGNVSTSAGAHLILIQVTFVLLGEVAFHWVVG